MSPDALFYNRSKVLYEYETLYGKMLRYSAKNEEPEGFFEIWEYQIPMVEKALGCTIIAKGPTLQKHKYICLVSWAEPKNEFAKLLLDATLKYQIVKKRRFTGFKKSITKKV